MVDVSCLVGAATKSGRLEGEEEQSGFRARESRRNEAYVAESSAGFGTSCEGGAGESGTVESPGAWRCESWWCIEVVVEVKICAHYFIAICR